MARVPRLAVVALLLVALPAATAGVPTADVAAGPDDPTDGPAFTDLATEREPGGNDSTVSQPDDVEATSDDPPTADLEPTARANGNETPSRLRLDDDPEAGYARPGPDLAATVATGDGQVESGYGLYWHTYRVERADNASHRRELIEAALTHAEERIDELGTREAAAIRAYYEGSADARELLGTLARIDAQSETIRLYLEDLKSYDAVDGALENDIQDAIRGTQLLEGPVRNRIRDGHAGRSEPPVIRVSTTRDGLVLETVTDGRYVREAVRHDHHDPDSQGGFDDIRQQMSEQYPGTFDPEPAGGWGWSPTHEPGLFLVDFVEQVGTVTLYFDSGSGQVYREQQSLQLSNLATDRVASQTDGGFKVTVDRADGGSPILVNVSAIARSVDAIVRIDGERVGRTGDDGQLWAVAPAGEHEVTVVGPGNTVNLTVPAEPTGRVDPGASGTADSRSTPDADVSTSGTVPTTPDLGPSTRSERATVPVSDR